MGGRERVMGRGRGTGRQEGAGRGYHGAEVGIASLVILDSHFSGKDVALSLTSFPSRPWQLLGPLWSFQRSRSHHRKTLPSTMDYTWTSS